MSDVAARPAVVCLDEPTRGMDRDHKQELADLLDGLGSAVIVATHDPEFAAAFAQRVVLLADGAPIADGTASEVLAGGSYFATETARILGGAGGALTPADGAALIAQRRCGGQGGDRVSWQLGAFGLLAVALGAGFAWYERERPDARIVALVGTLAAFAALGRIAFAAVPNVKPTTDIVLVAGYALGGAPGFAVGALAALTSNFFFGQGPWTPWQMAAWAATGVLGAFLAWGMRTRARADDPPPLGRWPLAIVCCAAGFAFTVVQDVGDWVSFSDHSWAQLGVYVGQGLGFDAVHAAGCLAFALALGPALARSIQRFARRTKVTWVPAERVAAPLLVAAVVLGGLGLGLGSRGPAIARAAAAARSPASVTAAAANYLLGSENADGGFGPAPGQPSDQLYAGWAALGLAAAGHDLNQLGDAAGLLDYVRAGAGTPRRGGAGAHHPRRARRRSDRALVRRPRSGERTAATRPRGRLDLRPGQPHRVRGAGAARRRGGTELEDDALARAPTGPRRRLQLLGRGRLQRHRRHRRRARGARRRSRGRRALPGGGLPAPPAEP